MNGHLGHMIVRTEVLTRNHAARRREHELLRIRAELSALRQRRRRETARGPASRLTRARTTDPAPCITVAESHEVLR